MESYVLKRTEACLEGGKETQNVIVELVLEDVEVSKFELDQQQIHCIFESDSSSDEFEFDFGIYDNENEVSHLFGNGSVDIGGGTKNYTDIELKQYKPCLSMAVNAVWSRKPTRRVVIDGDTELVESGTEIVDLSSDDSCDDINFETYHRENEPVLNVSHPIANDKEDLEENELARKENHKITNKKSVQKRKSETNIGNGEHKPIKKYKYQQSWCCVIDELAASRLKLSREKVHSTIPYARKLEIVLQGRPFPYKTYGPTPYHELLFKVQERDYTTFPWLTACLKQKKLFCWPCSTVYRDFKMFNPDLVSEFGIKVLLLHSRDLNHKYAEAHYTNWLEDLAQNKTPTFDFLSRPYSGDWVPSRDFLRRYGQKNGEQQIEQITSATTAKPSIIKASMSNKTTIQQEAKQEKSAETKKDSSKNQLNIVASSTNTGCNTVDTLSAITELPSRDFLRRYEQKNGEQQIEQNASATTAKSSIIKASMSNKTTIQQEAKQEKSAETKKDSSKNQLNIVASSANTGCNTVDTLSAVTELPPLPNLLSLLDQTALCHDLETGPCNKNDFQNLPQPHIFNSMGIPGTCKYYIDDVGVVSYIVVIERYGESAYLNVLTQDNSRNTLNNDHDYNESSKSRKYKVDKLLELNHIFYNSIWTHEQRIEIMKTGGPCPEVVNLLPMDKGRYNFMVHEGGHWLVASAKGERVVCWPCLLYGTIWDVKRNYYSHAVDRHAVTEAHLKSCIKYYDWAHENIGTLPKSNFKITPGLLRCLIDVVCSVLMRINNGPVPDGDIFTLLRVVVSQDMKLENQLYIISKGRGEIRGVGNSGANNAEAVLSPLTKMITKSIETCMWKRIKYELGCTNSVCLILSRVKDQSLVSVVLRYVTQEGDVVERFLKFSRAESCLSGFGLFKEIYDIMQGFECGNKLAGYTLDGVMMKLEEMWQFDCTMIKIYSKAKLFHYRAHDLRTTLLEFLSELTYIKVFYHQMNDLLRFLRHKEDIVDALKKIDSGVGENLADSPYGLIVTVKDHYPIFLQLLEKILSRSQDWTSETVVEASQFLEFLQHFHNRFYIVTLAWILSSVKPFAECFNKGLNFTDLKGAAINANGFLRGIRVNFARVYELAKNILVAHIALPEADASEEHYKKIYLEITDSALRFVHVVSEIIQSWSMSECKVFHSLQYPRKELPRGHVYNRLIKTCKGFTKDGMAAQLRMVHYYSFFEPLKNDPMKFIKFLREFDLQETLKELYALLELILTVPMTTIETTTKTSATDRAAAYMANNKNLDSTGWMKINSDLLSAMSRKNDFYANVTGTDLIKQYLNCSIIKV